MAKQIKIRKDALKLYIKLKELKAQVSLLSQIRAYVPNNAYTRIRSNLLSKIETIKKIKLN